jgi:hypothetical protein
MALNRHPLITLESSMAATLHSRVGVGLIAAWCLWLSGCAGLAYRHMNDPSRDAWQVVEKLAFVPGSRVADLGAGGIFRPFAERLMMYRS